MKKGLRIVNCMMASSSTVDVDGVSFWWLRSAADVDAAVNDLQHCSYVSIDVEGDCLGHKGRAATIQLCGQRNGSLSCFIVDLPCLPSNNSLPDSLRWLLESPATPIKVCHGFDGDQINLIEQYGVDFSCSHLFDTQEALNHLQKGGGQYDHVKKGLLDILEAFSDTFTPELGSEMRKMKDKLRFVDFFRRPLAAGVERYVCLDVLHIGGAYQKMRALLETQYGSAPDNSAQEQSAHSHSAIVASVIKGSRYRGPYGKGDCYVPPTAKQKERKMREGWGCPMLVVMRRDHSTHAQV